MSACFEAVVIGGGPAGAMSALHLARLGWRVALVERRPRYRQKTCGHCLNPRAVSTLKAAGLLQSVQAVAVGTSSRFRAHWPAQRSIDVSLKGCAAESEFKQGLLVERSQFDQL